MDAFVFINKYVIILKSRLRIRIRKADAKPNEFETGPPIKSPHFFSTFQLERRRLVIRLVKYINRGKTLLVDPDLSFYLGSAMLTFRTAMT